MNFDRVNPMKRNEEVIKWSYRSIVIIIVEMFHDKWRLTYKPFEIKYESIQNEIVYEKNHGKYYWNGVKKK